MPRRLAPLVAIVTLLGACASSPSSTPEPGGPSASRGADRQRGDRGAQGRPGGRVMAQREDMLMRGITLSAEQRERIEAIRATYRTQMAEAREQGGTDRTATRDRVQALMEKQQSEVRAVLDAEQRAQFDRNLAEMRERQQRGGRRAGRDGRS